MTCLVIQAAILAITMGCAGGPDEFELGYGHIWAGDSSLEGWNIANDDADMVTVGLVWKLRPTRVVVENPVVPAVRWTLEPELGQELNLAPELTESQDAQEAEAAAPEEEQLPTPGEVSDAIEAFDAFGTVTKIGFFLLAGLVLWTYRERLGRLIPGGNGKKKD